MTYRLPTEAEWEYVAKAGTATPWSFGSEARLICRFGNSADASTTFDWNHALCSDHHPFTSPVGRYLPNPRGIYDMHGNVREWCADWYVGTYASAPEDGSENLIKHQNLKVLRGGSWLTDPASMRSSARYKYSPEARNDDFGFRLLRE